MDHDGLTPEQAAFLAKVGLVRPSGDQSVAQAVSLAVASFIHACRFAGLEPVPSEQVVLGALVEREWDPHDIEPMPQSRRMGRLRPDRPSGRTAACRRCQRPAPPLDEPAALHWELIAEDGEVVGVICPDCLTQREQRAIRAEKARVLRRLKRGLPSS